MPDGVDVVAPMAHPATGDRRVQRHGNVGSSLLRYLVGLPAGTYYWSVQAIDSGYKGSAWAPEAQFVVPP